MKTINIRLPTAGLILFVVGVLAVIFTGSTLELTCVRNESSQMICSKQWTFLGVVPRSRLSPFDFAELRYTCYKDGCNYYLDHVDGNKPVTLSGTSAEPVDAFLAGRTNHLRYQLANWSTFIPGIFCVATSAFTLAILELISTYRKAVWQKLKLKTAPLSEAR